MGKVLEFPHAGVALAVPEGFEPQNVSEPFDVLRAALLKGFSKLVDVLLEKKVIKAKDAKDAMKGGFASLLESLAA